jgi:hypothetical protein
VKVLLQAVVHERTAFPFTYMTSLDDDLMSGATALARAVLPLLRDARRRSSALLSMR